MSKLKIHWLGDLPPGTVWLEDMPGAHPKLSLCGLNVKITAVGLREVTCINCLRKDGSPEALERLRSVRK